MTVLVDPLSDLLRVVRLDGAYFYQVEGGGSWHIEAVAARELSPRIMPGAEHLVSYHILTEGRCYGGLVGEPQIELRGGDAILFPQGDPHVMSSEPAELLGRVTPTTGAGPFADTLRIGDDPARTSAFVCGFLGCDRRPFNPLLASLPRVLHLRGMSDPGSPARPGGSRGIGARPRQAPARFGSDWPSCCSSRR
ncbi:MAG: cupin domain-containing protein [Gemmatimonadales bacterium]